MKKVQRKIYLLVFSPPLFFTGHRLRYRPYGCIGWSVCLSHAFVFSCNLLVYKVASFDGLLPVVTACQFYYSHDALYYLLAKSDAAEVMLLLLIMMSDHSDCLAVQTAVQCYSSVRSLS